MDRVCKLSRTAAGVKRKTIDDPYSPVSKKLCAETDSGSVTYDIGKYIGQKIDDLTKKNILLNHWIPPRNYEFSH